MTTLTIRDPKRFTECLESVAASAARDDRQHTLNGINLTWDCGLEEETLRLAAADGCRLTTAAYGKGEDIPFGGSNTAIAESAILKYDAIPAVKKSLKGNPSTVVLDLDALGTVPGTFPNYGQLITPEDEAPWCELRKDHLLEAVTGAAWCDCIRVEVKNGQCTITSNPTNGTKDSVTVKRVYSAEFKTFAQGTFEGYFAISQSYMETALRKFRAKAEYVQLSNRDKHSPVKLECESTLVLIMTMFVD